MNRNKVHHDFGQEPAKVVMYKLVATIGYSAMVKPAYHLLTALRYGGLPLDWLEVTAPGQSNRQFEREYTGQDQVVRHYQILNELLSSTDGDGGYYPECRCEVLERICCLSCGRFGWSSFSAPLDVGEEIAHHLRLKFESVSLPSINRNPAEDPCLCQAVQP